MDDAIIIFEDNNLHPLGRFLRRGYRHVWCAVLDASGRYWVRHDLTLRGHAVEVVANADFDLASHYREHGYTVVTTTMTEYRAIGPTVANSCVGMVKQVVGIKAPAITPWQLHRHLTRNTIMTSLRSLLTPVGFGGGAKPPPAPAAPKPVPTPVEAAGSNVAAQYRQRQQQQAAAAGQIRNTGGFGGSLIQLFQLATKNLSGQ